MPQPSEALAWARNRGQSNVGPAFTEPPLYVLAITNGDLREIFGMFETIPGDGQLMSLFQDALEGRLPRLATFNTSNGETALEGQ